MCTFAYRYCDVHSLECRNTNVSITSGHSMYMILSLLPKVSTHFPRSKQYSWSEFSSTLKHVFMHLQLSHRTSLSSWNIVLFFRYPHHICHTIIITQDAFSSAHQSPWLAWSYMPCQWFYHCHRLMDSMISNYITLLLKCWLCPCGTMDNQHLVSINVSRSRYCNTNYPQLILDGMQCIHCD